MKTEIETAIESLPKFRVGQHLKNTIPGRKSGIVIKVSQNFWGWTYRIKRHDGLGFGNICEKDAILYTNNK